MEGWKEQDAQRKAFGERKRTDGEKGFYKLNHILEMFVCFFCVHVCLLVCVSVCVCVATCSEVITQQAEHPLGEDAGSEQVVAVVVHRELGPHLTDRQTDIIFIIIIIQLNSVQQVMSTRLMKSRGMLPEQ